MNDVRSIVAGVDGKAPGWWALAAVYATGSHADGQPGDVWVDDRFAETHVAPPPPGLVELDIEVEPYARE
jgi:hypothetical protein